MIRWKAQRRKALAAAVVSVVGGALLALPLTSAKAETAEVDLVYTCNGGVAKTPVRLNVTLTLQTNLAVGQPLDVKWGISYRNGAFLSPGLFGPGGRVSATGRVAVKGVPWSGSLDSMGSKEQDRLADGGALNLPDLVSGAVAMSEPGVFEIKPGRLQIDFTPPASEKVVNDDDPSVEYVGTDWTDFNDRLPQYNDIHNDVHASEVLGAEATFKFTGTGVDFITEQDYRAGVVQFTLDGKPGIPATADASKDADGNPVVVANQGNYTLWGMRGLPYDDHTLKVKKLDDKWAMVDGFRVVTEELSNPPRQFRATCTPKNAVKAIRVTVGGNGAETSPGTTPPVTPSATDTSTPPVDDSPNPDDPQSPVPTSPSPTTTPTPTVTPTATQTHLVAVVPQGSPTPTATVTVTLTATPSVAQVWVTPKGGAQTGEAVERTSAATALIGSGGVMLAIGVLSGVALLRRRAAHAGDPSVEGGRRR